MRQGPQHPRRSRQRSNPRRNNHQPNRLHAIDSNGPSGRVRGSAQQVYEKYLTLARDAASSGDTITAENLLQHAEHYFRLIQAHQQQAQRPQGANPATAGGPNGNQNGRRSRGPADLVAEAQGEFDDDGGDDDLSPDEGEDDRIEA